MKPTPTKEDNLYAERQLKFLWVYLKEYKVGMTIGVICVFASIAMEYSIPWILKLIIDHMSGQFTMETLRPYIFLLLGTIVLSSVFLYWLRYLVITASRKAEYHIRNDLFLALELQPRSFFLRNPVGDIMSRATNDLEQVRNLIGPGFLHIIRMGLALVYTSLMLFLISPVIAAVGLSLALLLPLVSVKYMRNNYIAFRDMQKSLSKMNVFIQESLSGISIIKSLGRENLFQKRFDSKSEEYRNFSRRTALRTTAIWPVITLVSSIGLCAAIFTGSYLIDHGQITIGELSASVLYLVKVQFPLVGLGWVLNMIQRGRASLDRIIRLRDDMEVHVAPNSIEAHDPSAEPRVFTDLKLQNVSYRYPNAVVNAISDLSLDFSYGKTLGIVGPTGCGKTTLAMILAGIYPPASGKYILNGIERTGVDSPEIMDYFSLAPQDGFLFSDTIRSNIQMGQNERTKNQVEDVADFAHLSKDLGNIPNGLDALLGEKGINLSGGQRQRTNLARAMLSGSPILILDDTLSAVDTETEHAILESIRTKFEGHSSIVISHRYSAVTHCDQVLYMEKGRVVESGTHTELLEKKGKYAQAFEMQILQEDLES